MSKSKGQQRDSSIGIPLKWSRLKKGIPSVCVVDLIKRQKRVSSKTVLTNTSKVFVGGVVFI